MAQYADAERIDQRIAEEGAVEGDLAADIGQAQAIAVAADAGNDPRQHSSGIRFM